jgi:AcrR family transcriptional regulator
MKHGERMKRLILDTGLRLWKENPEFVSARRIAKEINKNHASILYHFPKNSIRDAVASWAIIQGDSKVIVYLILEKHSSVESMSEAKKKFHLSAVR